MRRASLRGGRAFRLIGRGLHGSAGNGLMAPVGESGLFGGGEGAVLYLEDYFAGRRSRSPHYHVRREEIIEFARRWDPQPFHVDEESARASVHGGLIACSAHIFAIFCHLSNGLPEKTAALAGLGFDEMRLLRPVRPGDVLHLESECVETRRSRSRPDRGVVRSRARLVNQRGEDVFSVISTFLIRARQGAGGP